MAITVQSSGSISRPSFASTATTTISVTVNAGSGVRLLAGFATGKFLTQYVTGAKYGGVSLTEVTAASLVGSGNQHDIRWYALNNPVVGTANLTLEYSAANQDGAWAWLVIEGSDGAASLGGAVASDSSTGTSAVPAAGVTGSNMGVTLVAAYAGNSAVDSNTTSVASNLVIVLGEAPRMTAGYRVGGNPGTTFNNGQWTAGTVLIPAPTSSPVITVHPANQTVNQGSTATFSVTATGATSYQWQRNGANNISGATSASYTTPATTFSGGTANDGDTYRCVVTNAGGSVTSNSATLNVNVPDTTPPTLTGSVTITSVTSTTFTASWPAGSDNVAVTAYEYSLDAGSTWTVLGNVLTVNVTGRTPGSTVQFRVRAKDAAANVSTPALASAVTMSSSPATAATLSGPSSGQINVASTVFTAGVNGTLSSNVIHTPSDGGAGGVFSPTTVTSTPGALTATFTYTPASTGVKTISLSNNGGLTAPTPVSYTVSAAVPDVMPILWGLTLLGDIVLHG